MMGTAHGSYLCLAMSVHTCAKNLATVCSAFTVFREETRTSSTASAGTKYHHDAYSTGFDEPHCRALSHHGILCNGIFVSRRKAV